MAEETLQTALAKILKHAEDAIKVCEEIISGADQPEPGVLAFVQEMSI
jgi:hypothetical protein